MAMMNIPSLKREVRERYENTYCESKRLLNYSEIVNAGYAKEVSNDDLPNTDIVGNAIASYRKNDGKLYFSYTDENVHTILNGATGSGKTTGFIENNIYFLSEKKNKANLFITDPKGELFSRHAKRLRKNGYRVYILNFCDINHSNSWNPLLELYDMWQKRDKLASSITYHESTDELMSGSLKIQGSLKEFSASGFWSVDNLAFPTEEKAEQYVTAQQATIESEVSTIVRQIANTCIPDDLTSQKDPIWMMGAKQLLQGMIYSLLEDSTFDASGLSRECFNLKTLNDYYRTIRSESIDLRSNCVKPLLDTRVLNHKSLYDESIRNMQPFFENNINTARSYLGVFEGAMSDYFNVQSYTLFNETTIDVESEDTPFAVFLTTKDYNETDYRIAALFIDFVYRIMVAKADLRGSVKRETQFILDEFANIPPLTSFGSKISTSRSRNVWFSMVIQSYAQLSSKYDEATAMNINDNSYNHIFLGSPNFETKQRFSRESGKRSIASLSSVLDPDDNKVVEIPVVTISDLDNIQSGYAYMRIKNKPILYSKFERSYECAEFETTNTTTPEEMGFASTPYNHEKYRYDYLFSGKTMYNYVLQRQQKSSSSFVF